MLFTQVTNKCKSNLTNEKIFSAELVMDSRSPNFNAKVNIYRTEWKDRWLEEQTKFTLR
jgi:hypothetical protein